MFGKSDNGRVKFARAVRLTAQQLRSFAAASAGANAEKTKAVGPRYHKGMAVLTLAKGDLMYEAALAGQKYSFKSK